MNLKMKLKNLKSKGFTLAAVGSILAMSALMFYSVARCAEYYKIEQGQTQIITECSITKEVKNNSGTAIFIPTKTCDEWNSFISNPPSGVTIAGAAFCGNGKCDTGENCSTCSNDCKCSSGYNCVSGTCVAPSCTASCGPCSVPCGGGSQTCTKTDCSTYTQSCNTQPCCAPVNGGWSGWTCGPCSAPCGGGTQTCTRSCTNPPPFCGGAYCSGPATVMVGCNAQPCPFCGDGACNGNESLFTCFCDCCNWWGCPC